MTAEALLCRMYLGWNKDQAGPGRGRRAGWPKTTCPASGSPNIYYWYYATQVMHHLRRPAVGRLEPADARHARASRRRRGGHAAGSWDPAGEHAGAGGRIYMTALAICTLEVYYRHLPIFRQIELGK